jgi:hypothetical protein
MPDGADLFYCAFLAFFNIIVAQKTRLCESGLQDYLILLSVYQTILA